MDKTKRGSKSRERSKKDPPKEVGGPADSTQGGNSGSPGLVLGDQAAGTAASDVGRWFASGGQDESQAQRALGEAGQAQVDPGPA